MTYIAYGSNMSLQELRKHCPCAFAMGTAYLEGWILQCRGAYHRAYLTLEPKEGGIVPAVVWDIAAGEEKALDEYEDCPNLYHKVRLQVEYLSIWTETPVQAEGFMYLMNDGYPLAVPTEEYMTSCAMGYAVFQFPMEGLMATFRRAIMAASENLDDPDQSVPTE